MTRNVLVQPSTYGTDNRCHLEALATFGPTARMVEIVFDHLAHIPQPEGVNNPLYGMVRALMDKGRTWVKLSGAYADTKVGPPTYSDSSAVARAYAKAMPERCVWGSDWPHPSEQSKHLPDDAVLFDLLTDWVLDEKTRHRVLVENPATLYDFPKG